MITTTSPTVRAEPGGPTVGVEEEFHLVAATTRRPTSGAERVLDRLDGAVFGAELPASQVETRSGVHRDMDQLRLELASHRSAVVAAAAAEDLRVVSCGSVPSGDWREQPVTGGARYERMTEMHAQVAYQQAVAACQVHVGVPDRDTAVRLTEHVRPWLAVLLALSSSSPFWERRDTGFASWRLIIWNSWVVSGPPPVFASGAEYERTVEALLRTGTILDAKQLYWHVRPNRSAPTLEFRIADACTTVEETMLVVALARALVTTAGWHLEEDRRVTASPDAVLRAAAWRAARHGLGGELLDPRRHEPVPAGAAVTALLEHVGPALDHHDDRGHVHPTLDRVMRLGSSADRQRRAVARRGKLVAAVELLIEQTSAGLDA